MRERRVETGGHDLFRLCARESRGLLRQIGELELQRVTANGHRAPGCQGYTDRPLRGGIGRRPGDLVVRVIEDDVLDEIVPEFAVGNILSPSLLDVLGREQIPGAKN